jgi:hypothetical protein
MRRASVLAGLALTVTACGAASASAPHSGIAGRVVAGPTCPVQRIPPDPACAPRPLAATLRVRRADGRGTGATVRSASDGRFRVALAPATYVVTPQAPRGSPFPRPPAASRVRVRSGQLTRITIAYDTGIR